MKTLTNLDNHIVLLEDTIRELSQDKQELSMMCEEKETELERVRTTVYALNDKLAIFNDIENELKVKNESLLLSEKKRVELQKRMEETSIKITEDAKFHKETHERLKQEIQELLGEIKKERQVQFDLQQQHIVDLGKKDEEIKQVKLNYEAKIKELKDESFKKEHDAHCHGDHTAEEHAKEKERLEKERN